MSMSEMPNKAKKKSTIPDPYAGQYPPPPPLPAEDMTVKENQRPESQYDQEQPSSFYANQRYESVEQQHSIPIANQRYELADQQEQSFSQTNQRYEQPQSSSYTNQGYQSAEPQELYEEDQQNQPFYIVNPSSSHHNSYTSSHHTTGNMPQPAYEDNRSNSYNNISTHSSYHSIPEPARGHYYESNSVQNYNASDEATDYHDPEALTLKEYLYAERQAKLRRQQELQEQMDLEQQKQQQLKQQQLQQQYMNGMEDDYRHHHPPPRPESLYYNNNNNLSFQNKEQSMYGSPMMAHPPMFNQHQSNPMFSPRPQNFLPPPAFPPPLLHNQSSNPSMIRPVPMMMNTNDEYQTRGGCCLGVSFCAFLWTLVLFLFMLAGIGLIVATKILGDKCYASSDYKNTNSVLCGQLLHDAFLYGGIAVAGLSLLIILWRIIIWSSRRKRNRQV